jgi:hypothetical protein
LPSLMSSPADSRLRGCFQGQIGSQRRQSAPCQRKTISFGPLTWLYRQRCLSSLSAARLLSLCMCFIAS